MKVCNECKKEFEPVNQKGSEQIYCSRKCAAKAANKRRIEKIISRAIQQDKPPQLQPEPKSQNQKPTNNEDRSLERDGVGGITSEGRVIANNDLAYIEKFYEAKIELNLYKLKTENLENKVKELEREIFDLNSEIDQLEKEDTDNGFLSGISNQFKKDPVNTVNMATAIFENIFKNKPTPNTQNK